MITIEASSSGAGAARTHDLGRSSGPGLLEGNRVQPPQPSFLKEVDFSRDELLHLLRLADALKDRQVRGERGAPPGRQGDRADLREDLDAHALRVRGCAYDQGAHVTYLDPTGSQMGHKESTADTAQVLGRMFDGIEYRGSAQGGGPRLARFAASRSTTA